MQKTIITLLLLLATAVSATAHTIGVGYAVRQKGTASGLKAEGKTACEAAILLGNDKLKMYGGNEIRTVRVSLPSTKVYVDSVVVWVRQSLDGPDISSAKITRFKNDAFGTIHKGWNEVELDAPVAITDDSRFYVGYTYYQRTTVCATCLTNTKYDNTSFVKLGNSAEWTETTGGTLAIEAGIDGNDMPDNDLWLMSARGLILGNGTRQIEARVYNRGQKAANSIRFAYNGKEYNGTSEIQSAIQPDTLCTITFDIDGAENIEPGTQLGLEISKVNSSTDENTADNKTNCLFNYLRIVLVEEFTTERCPNCPQAAEYLHEIGTDNTLSRHIAVVCHHAGYHTDRFTSPTDVAYEWFYNNEGGTFAPAIMYNRMPLVATSSGTMSPATSVMGKEDIVKYISDIVNEESGLVITSTANMSADGKMLTVEVKGKKLRDFGSGSKRITVFLTEDNVLADGQAGSGTDTYYHQHVMRGVNTTWGEPIVWQGDEFVYSYTFNIDDTWKKTDLKTVASVGDYDSTDAAKCRIENTTIAIPDTSTGIKSTESKYGVPVIVGYYTIEGCKATNLQNAVYIAKYSDGTTRKVVGCGK